MKRKYEVSFTTGGLGVVLLVILAVPMFLLGALFMFAELVSHKYEAWKRKRQPPCN